MDTDIAFINGLKSGNRTQQGSLTATTGTKQAGAVAGFQFKINVVNDNLITVSALNIVELQDRVVAKFAHKGAFSARKI